MFACAFVHACECVGMCVCACACVALRTCVSVHSGSHGSTTAHTYNITRAYIIYYSGTMAHILSYFIKNLGPKGESPTRPQDYHFMQHRKHHHLVLSYFMANHQLERKTTTSCNTKASSLSVIIFHQTSKAPAGTHELDQAYQQTWHQKHTMSVIVCNQIGSTGPRSTEQQRLPAPEAQNDMYHSSRAPWKRNTSQTRVTPSVQCPVSSVQRPASRFLWVTRKGE